MSTGLPLREAADPRVLAADAAAALLRGAPWRRLAIVGDSLAAGVGDPTPGYAPQSWPERLLAALRANRPDVAYLNTGQVGARVGAVRADQLGRALAFAPDLACVIAGANDLFVTEPNYAEIEADLGAIYAALAAQGADLFAVTIADIFDAHPTLAPMRERLMVLNDRVRAVAARHGATLVEMWTHPVRHDPELMSPDGIHFASLGHAVLATEVITALQPSAQ